MHNHPENELQCLNIFKAPGPVLGVLWFPVRMVLLWNRRLHTHWKGQFSDSHPPLMGLTHLRPPTAGVELWALQRRPPTHTHTHTNTHTLSHPLPGSNPLDLWQRRGCSRSPLATLTRLSWALPPVGAHTLACPRRSARNPKQHSWVGRREGPAIPGTQKTPPRSPFVVTRDPRRCSQRLKAQPNIETKNFL